jgi:chromosome partitioning protein
MPSEMLVSRPEKSLAFARGIWQAIFGHARLLAMQILGQGVAVDDKEFEESGSGILVPAARRAPPFIRIPPCVIVVAAWKGGVGKTTLAYELAYLLGGVLVDLDWDRGGATVAWGYRPEQRSRVALLDALESGRIPRPLLGNRKPDLIPSHPDFGPNQPPAEKMADALEAWCRALGRVLVVDTHPGGVPSTYGAMAAGYAVVVPSVLATKELEALEGMLEEVADYPLVIAPNMVPGSPPASELDRFERAVRKAGARVAPPVSEHKWLRTRKGRLALTSYDPEPKRIGVAASELRALARVVADKALERV